MDFAYTAAQTARAAELAALFDRHRAPARLRAQHDTGGDAFDAALWRELANGGWIGSTSRADEAGSGDASDELTLAACAAGHALAPIPLVATLLAGVALKAGAHAAHGRDLAAGSLRVALCLPPPQGAAPTVSVTDGLARGTFATVADGLIADALLGADAAGEAWLVDLRSGTVERRPLTTLDLAHSAAEVMIDGASALALGPVEGWRDRAAILLPSNNSAAHSAASISPSHTPRSATPSASRSAPFRRSSTSSPRCTSTSSSPAPTPISAHTHSPRTPRRCWPRPPRWPARAPPTRICSPRRRACTYTAASVSRGPARRTCTCAAPARWRPRSAARRSGGHG